jgi:DNA-binding transcriptional LysR family regulator
MKWEDRIGRRVKLHDLHVLMTVAELGSMGKAAERLAVSQPSVSKAISDLEYVVGVRLLDRTPRGVETTAYGRALLTRGMGAFDELRQGIKDIESLTDPAVGEVRIGCPEAISAGLLSAVIDRFSQQYAHAIVSVNPADHISQEFKQLRDRRVDFLVGRIPRPFTADDLEAEILYQDQLYIVSGRNSRWCRRRKIELADLLNEPWLLTPSMFSTLIEGFQASNLAGPRVNVNAYSTHQCIKLIATGRFISALSGSVLRFSVDPSPFKVLPIKFPVRQWSVGIVTLKSRTVSPIVKTFMSCVREVAKALAN